MKYYLKTKQECDAIVDKCEAFYRADRIVEGQNVALYDYRLASLSDYVDNEAFELRGICFVEQSDGTWERNLLLQKFFNVNQTIGWMYDDVKDKKVQRIQNKEDGSIISFVEFNTYSNIIRAKSKMSFVSDQAVMAQEILDDNRIYVETNCTKETWKNFTHLYTFVRDCFTADLTPVFELVGFGNQIVLSYEMEKELILLQIRRKDGTYLNIDEMKNLADHYNIKMANDFEIFPTPEQALDALLRMKETSQKDIEGWIVTFEDGQMAKIKTDKYIQLHGLIGPDAFRENLLIQTILDGNIDDVIAQLVPGEKRESILEMEKLVSGHFNHLVVEFKNLRGEYYNKYQENRKEFAIANSKKTLFGAVMKSISGSFRDVEKIAEVQVKLHIEKSTNSLVKAKEWLENIKG